MAQQRVLFLSVFLLLTITVKSEENCVQKSPCSCEFEDGKMIDLKHLEEKPFLLATDGVNLTYYFHPCSDKKLAFPNKIPKLIKNECDNASLCLLNLTDATALNLGNAKDTTFRFTTNSDKFLVLNNNKHNITSIIHLSCADYLDPILHIKQIDAKTANLILFSTDICAFYEKHGFSTGSVLVIILFTFTSVYLFGGAAVLHFLRGARGKEMIPNFEFWSDLPLLVRDGTIFLQNGCKPNLSASESYDRI